MDTKRRKIQKGSDTVFSVQTNPLLIDTILQIVFSFVDYDTMKECRGVSRKWKEICDPKLIKSSAFALDISKKKLPKSYLEAPKDILSLFSSIDPEIVRFTSYKLTLKNLRSPIRETYWEFSKSTMVQLEIKITDYDWAQTGVNADCIIGPSLRKLKLCDSGKPWLISLDKLQLIRQIDLEKCKIVVNSSTKMAPCELKIKNCDLESSTKFVIPDNFSKIVNFHLIEKLYLSNDNKYEKRLPAVNFKDCANVKDLSLFEMRINLDGKISPNELILKDNKYKDSNGAKVEKVLLHDWLSSKNNNNIIRKMDLESEIGNIKLNFENLVISDELRIKGSFSINITKKPMETNTKKLILAPYCMYNRFALANLPKTLVSLEIIFNTVSFSNFEPVCFPELKYLLLKRCASYYSRFQQCDSLLYYRIENTAESFLKKFDVNLLPPNIKALSLRDICVPVVGNKIIKLDVLILSQVQYTLEQLISHFSKQLSNKINADLIVVHKFSNSNVFGEYQVVQIMEMKRDIPITCNFAFGPVGWHLKDFERPFRDSVLFSIVDKEAEYYLFKGQTGKAIDKHEFDKFITFNKY